MEPKSTPAGSSAANRAPELREGPARGRLVTHRGFASRFLPAERDLIVYLPPGYDEAAERLYPVLYMQDGQNLFEPPAPLAAPRTWRMDEHADAAIQAGEVEPLVIVGIYNTGDRRISEYTHEPDRQIGGGDAEAYGRLLTEELMPWVADRYRVRQERQRTGLGGSSLGALVSLYLGLRYPERFGRLALLSPSVWWNGKSILDYVGDRALRTGRRPRVWLDVGDQEGWRTVENAELLHRSLRTNGWKPGETLHFERIAGGAHDEASWSARVRPMLRFLFPAQR